MYRFDPGSTSVTIYFALRDANTGQKKTGLTATSSGAVCSYTRSGGSATPIALSQLSGPTAAWSQGGFCEVDPVNAPGLYRLDLPNAVCAAGAILAIVSLGFTGVIAEQVLVRLDKPGSLAGSGAIQVTVNVINQSTGLPLQGARVWISTDIGGQNVVAGTLNTDAFGNAVFFLNPGTYYTWVSDPGYSGANPTVLVVS